MQINLAFDQHEKIRFDGHAGASQALHQAGHVATGVDDPPCAAGLQLPDEFLEFTRDWRVLEFGKDGAVEIGGDETQLRFHAAKSIAENAPGCNSRERSVKKHQTPTVRGRSSSGKFKRVGPAKAGVPQRNAGFSRPLCTYF